jgi:hypothetical protein
MAGPRNRGSALAALAAAGGLWAWQNRDKIQTWITSQRGQLQRQIESAQTQQSQSQPSGSAPIHDAHTPSTSDSYTGQTRRIGAQDYDATRSADYTGSTPAPKQYDPEI